MNKLKKEQLFLFGLLLAIFPYFYLCFFTNPSADDFVFAYYFQTQEYFQLLKGTFLGWNGRYASNIFSYLNPIGFGSFFGYKIAPFLMILLFLSSSFYFVKQLFFKEKLQFQITISLVLSLLFFHNMPIISEGVYWFTGSVIYFLGIIIFQFYIGLLIKTIRKKRCLIRGVPLIILLFFVCGFNEVLTLLVLFLLSIITIVFYKNQLERKSLVVIQLLFAILFASILIFAPGNGFRGDAYVEAYNFTHSLSYSILQVARFSFYWIVSIPLIIASIFYFEINKKMRKENVVFQNSFYLNRWLSLLFLFTVTFICVFPPYWLTGILGQHRTLNVAYAFFLPFWFVNLTVWYNYYNQKINLNFLDKTKRVLGIVLFLGLIITANGFNALKDVFSGSARQYDIQLKERFKRLQKNTPISEKLIKFKPIKTKPKCLFTSDITANPKDWKNKAYNLYFCQDSLKIYIK
ncbi:MAG: hypothetical protein COB15_04850 [Flavobacteriales bacterium]|nr:MAG: hypothetical protein COB15_04850 [Flavobacteriales bacterium]